MKVKDDFNYSFEIPVEAIYKIKFVKRGKKYYIKGRSFFGWWHFLWVEVFPAHGFLYYYKATFSSKKEIFKFLPKILIEYKGE